MTKYEKGPDRGPSHINRNWPVFAPTSWLVLSPTLTTGTVFGHTPHTGYLAITWTSATNGSIDISGGIWEGRDINRSNNWWLTKNGVSLTSGLIGSGDPYNSSNPFNFLTGSGGSSAITDVSANLGDLFQLVVRPSSNSAGDYFAVNLAISQSNEVSEPETLIIFGLGLAGLGFARRKRAG
jgi:hypothetical protein